MNVDLNKEEIEFLMRYCKRLIQLSEEYFRKDFKIFDPEFGENKEKATILYNKLKNSNEAKS